MQMLLWKEWHEHAWKLTFGSLMLGAFALIGLRARVVADEELMQTLCTIAVLLLPLLAGTGLVPPERSDGSLDTLLALPVKPSSIFLAKTIMGIILCAGPILVALLVSLFVAQSREMMSSAIVWLFIRTLMATLVLFAWIITLTIGLPTETRAALIAIGVLVAWLIVTGGLADKPIDQARSKFWLINPFVFLFGKGRSESGAIVWAVSLLKAGLIQGGISLLLWHWASRQLVKPVEERA